MLATISDYMDAARRTHGLRSDRALARKLDLSQQSLSYWRTGKNHPSEIEMQRLAQLAGADESRALLLLNVWRAKDQRTRENFLRLLRFFGAQDEPFVRASLASSADS
jgi:transcriptional regulator with XRE-family HTH domain